MFRKTFMSLVNHKYSAMEEAYMYGIHPVFADNLSLFLFRFRSISNASKGSTKISIPVTMNITEMGQSQVLETHF